MPELQTLLTGLAFGESPRWHGDRLWFSNWGTQEALALDIEGKSEVIVRVPTTIPFCIDWLPDGRLLVVLGRKGLLLRREPDGELLTHAILSSLARIWNEIVVDGRGNVYINGGDFNAPGIIALLIPAGLARQVAEGLASPNDMCVSPDNQTLIVTESFANRLTAFDIEADGSLSNRREWAALEGFAPDGICLDAEGAVWYGDVPNKCCMRVREGDEVLQTIPLDRGCFACMLGEVNRQTLFLMVAEWRGFENMADLARSCQVLITRAPALGVGTQGL